MQLVTKRLSHFRSEQGFVRKKLQGSGGKMSTIRMEKFASEFTLMLPTQDGLGRALCSCRRHSSEER